MVLREAVGAVSAAKVPEAFREVAFAKGVDYLLHGASPATRAGKPPPAKVVGAQHGSQGGVEPIAARLELDPGAIERVFEVDGDDVHLVVARKALPASKKGAVNEIAYLITAARQALGVDDVTTAATIRNVCEQFGVLDGNFAASVGDIGGQGIRISGSGSSRTFKINKAGYEQAAVIVTRLMAEAPK